MMRLAYLSLTVYDRDGTKRTLIWRNPSQMPNMSELVQANTPVRHRRASLPLRLEWAAALDESLEATGDKMALFSRLLDEHGLSQLPENYARKASARSQAIKEVTVTDHPPSDFTLRDAQL